jgi:hypothetical protein
MSVFGRFMSFFVACLSTSRIRQTRGRSVTSNRGADVNPRARAEGAENPGPCRAITKIVAQAPTPAASTLLSMLGVGNRARPKLLCR